MHDTAVEAGSHFFSKYWRDGFSEILDVGSLDVNGSLRQFTPEGANYVGLDIEEGASVDVVLEAPHAPFPFDSETFDLIVSTSCFEHDQMFWKTFIEMVRVLKPTGFIYINAPSNGAYHGYPFDNWRFYPDSARALCEWANFSGFSGVKLVESMTLPRAGDIWNDFVMVFAGAEAALPEAGALLADKYEVAYNIRRFDREDFQNFSMLPEDMLKLNEKDSALSAEQVKYSKLDGEYRALVEQCAQLTGRCDVLTQELDEKNAALVATQSDLEGVRSDLDGVRADLAALEGTILGRVARYFLPRKAESSPV